MRTAGPEEPRVHGGGSRGMAVLPNSLAPATPSCLAQQQALGTGGSHKLWHPAAVQLWGQSSPPPQQLQVTKRSPGVGAVLSVRHLTVPAMPRGGRLVASRGVGEREAQRS